MKILCAIPTYPNPPLWHEATEESIKAQVFPDDWIVDTLFMRTERALMHRDDLVWKHNRAREMVLDGEYDALWSVEADMLPPPDALVKLATVPADVAYGLYSARSTGMWLCFPEIGPQKAGHKAITYDPKAAAAAWGNIVPSQGVGMGCTLIHRRVLEQVTFRVEGGIPFHDDWIFALDCVKAGFTQMHHCGVICGHILTNELAIYPALDASTVFRRYESGQYN